MERKEASESDGAASCFTVKSEKAGRIEMDEI